MSSFGGILNLAHCGKKVMLYSYDDDYDRGWIERFFLVARKYLVQGVTIPESWNMNLIGLEKRFSEALFREVHVTFEEARAIILRNIKRNEHLVSEEARIARSEERIDYHSRRVKKEIFNALALMELMRFELLELNTEDLAFSSMKTYWRISARVMKMKMTIPENVEPSSKALELPKAPEDP
ncbi:hypothetical protein HAX54_007713 [Datura stramonium]|uniref:Uncharacterized protein n=1 Tax=Datura stramonium TaxID=4076 RepID=A0ABS8TC92_DATST|nr:hypothetical protein [Datura stramonium]